MVTWQHGTPADFFLCNGGSLSSDFSEDVTVMLSCSQMASFYTANVCVIIRGMKTESMPAAAIELKFGSGPYEGWFLKGAFVLFVQK